MREEGARGFGDPGPGPVLGDLEALEGSAFADFEEEPAADETEVLLDQLGGGADDERLIAAALGREDPAAGEEDAPTDLGELRGRAPRRARRAPRRLRRPVPAAASTAAPAEIEAWLRAQRTNLARHAAALRPFRAGEFGRGAASPSESHRQAARQPSFDRLRAFTRAKERGVKRVKSTEQVWSFYYSLFNQRQSPVAKMLLACDRIGLDCYQAAYTGLGRARSIPSPPPFSFLETQRAPATFRRGVVLTRLVRHPNPFPLIKLPYHRLVNPWTLGAVPHEVAHNLQNDLGLWSVLPKKILQRLVTAGVDRSSAGVWARWHKEIFADLCGLLLAGPAFVTSLMTVVGRSPRRTVAWNPVAVHPVPYLRVFVALELLRRMGFRRRAAALGRAWNRLYPRHLAASLPGGLLRSFDRAHRLVGDTLCYRPYPQLGGKALAAVIPFGAKEQTMIEEAGRRLAAGTDPGILPERFLIGASRVALERRLARPGVITRNFYNALGRR